MIFDPNELFPDDESERIDKYIELGKTISHDELAELIYSYVVLQHKESPEISNIINKILP